MKKTRNISGLRLEHKRFAVHLDAFLCELHAGRGGMQICDTFCHAMITRKHVAMETAITIVAIFQLLSLSNQDSKLLRIWRQTIIQRIVGETLTI